MHQLNSTRIAGTSWRASSCLERLYIIPVGCTFLKKDQAKKALIKFFIGGWVGNSTVYSLDRVVSRVLEISKARHKNGGQIKGLAEIEHLTVQF